MNVIRIIPFLILFSLASCKRSSRYDSGQTQDFVPPLIVRTALSDTLPATAIRRLQLENVHGIKVKYPTGQFVSYFDYNADQRAVLNTISTLPFSKYTLLADTTCRRIPIESIGLMKSMVAQEELESGSSFWQANVDEFDVYECIKAPLRHTLLIAKKTKRVIHRIEYTG